MRGQTTTVFRPPAGQRLGAIRRWMRDAGAVATLVANPANLTYLTGFRALLYSRPILLVIGTDSLGLVVPGLEEAHARAEAGVDELLVYHEHPEGGGFRAPLPCLDALLASAAKGRTVGIELSTLPAGVAQHLATSRFSLVDADPALRRLRAVKDESEIAVIREAARVAAVGVAASLAACSPRTTEIEVDSAGTSAIMAEVSDFRDPVAVEQLIMTPTGAERTVLPHVLSSTRRLLEADGLIHTRQVGLNGYRAELERTAFVRRVDSERQKLFETVTAAQRAAVESVTAGVRCCDVDAAARRVLTKAGLERFAIHRTGHGIGLSPHEPPYVRFDEDARLEENMVITVEPGAYVPGVGGFRHSDTVVVNTDGCERLTSFPTDLRELTIGADPRLVS